MERHSRNVLAASFMFTALVGGCSAQSNPAVAEAQTVTETQTEALTGCTKDCLGGACVAGMCQPIELAGRQSRAEFLAISATDVYWGGTVNHTVNKAPLIPGPIETFASGKDGVFTPLGVAVASGYVVWANEQGGTIMRAAPGSSEATPVIIAAGQSAPIGIATDGVFAYWTNYGSGTISRIHIRFAADEVPEILTQNQSHPEGIALHDGFLYWANEGGGGAVRRLSLANPALVTNLATGGTPFSLAVDDTSVYWVDGSSVRKAPVAGNSGDTTLVPGQSNPAGITIDDQHIFWSNYDDGTVMRADLNGANPIQVATGQRHPYTITQDALAIYWVNDDASSDCASPPCGGVMKLAK